MVNVIDDTLTQEEAHYVLRDGLAVYRFGSGSPVLLMPGPHRFEIPGDGSAQPMIDGLVRQGRQVISFDPPESGRSTRPAQVTMEEMHRCADEALDTLDVAGAVDVFGHSMSGLVALAYALERPARVPRLMLVGTGSGGRAYMNAHGALWNRRHPQFIPMAVRAVFHIVWPRLAAETLLNNFIDRWSYYDTRNAQRQPISPEDWWKPKRGRTDWHRTAVHLDYMPRLKEIAAPTLILCGRYDPQYPLACSQELTAGIPAAHLTVFEHSGHYPFIEEPVAFWHSIGKFLA